VLASVQTNSALKTFLDATFGLRNVANTFTGVFTNTITAARTWTLKDASGTIAFTSDITGTNSGTNTGDQTITNSSNATSHTVTLSASGGSVQLVEGANITLTTTGTGSAGIVTIASTAGGTGTVTATGGSLTSNAVVLGAGTVDTKVSTGITTDGTAQLNLGVNATTIGKVKMFGNTSGDVTIQPTAAAGTATVQTLPATTGTLVNRVTTANGVSASNTDGALTVTLGAITPTTVDIGNADTTISRSAAGVIAVEGVVIPSISSTNVLSNKTYLHKYTAQTTTYSIATTDEIINCTSGTFTVTLPTAVGVTGQSYTIKNSGAGVITIATTSSQTIDGVTTATLSVQYESRTVVSDGANWIEL
jgi:hypothetical protein